MTAQFALFNVNLRSVPEKCCDVKNEITDIVADYCTFVSFDSSVKTNLYKAMFSTLSLVTQDSPFVDVTTLVDTKDVLYVLAYVELPQCTSHEEYESYRDKFNTFCSQISGHNIIGNCAIAKLHIGYVVKDNVITMDTYPTSIDKSELIDVLCSFFTKKGIIAKASNETIQYTFSNHPFEPLLSQSKDINKDFKVIDIELYNRLIRVIFDTRQTQNSAPLNENISFLCNKFVYGNVCVAMLKKPIFNEDIEFVSLSEDVFNSFIQLRKKSAEEGTMVQNSPDNYINFEISLHTALEKYKNDPDRTLQMLDKVSLNEDN